MFGSDGSPIVQYVVIFAVIFTALAAIVFVVRRLTGRGLALAGRAAGRGRQPRLGIVDVYELDRARHLILLRRDNVEHLLLVGGPNDVVVERNIQRGQRPPPEAALRPEPLAEPLPDPLAGAGRLPEPARSAPEIAGRRSEPLFDPGFSMPVVVPSPVPGSGATPPVTLPLDAALLGGDEPGQDISVPDISVPLSAPPRAPAARSGSVPEAASPVTAPAREPFSPRRLLRRTPPPLVEPRPEPASERGLQDTSLEDTSLQDTSLKDTPSRTEPEPSIATPAARPIAPQAERRTVDPAILSDMARQLQAALARPSSAVTPAPPRAAAIPPVTANPPAAARAAEGVDPTAAAMASAPSTLAADAAQASAPAVAAPPPAPPAATQDRPSPPVAEPPSAVRQPPPAAAPPAPKKASPAPPPAAPAPKPEPKSQPNPFSVEEIEAEFARLLGRPLDKR